MTGFEARQGITRRDFLRRRDTDTPDKAATAARQVIADWETQRIKVALGTIFHRTSRVVIVKPWWMPHRLFMALLSAIVVETKGDIGERTGR